MRRLILLQTSGENMAVKLDSRKMQDKVKEGLKRYQEATDADREERSLAIDDVVFAFSEGWSVGRSG